MSTMDLPLVCSDLDRTLIYSKSALELTMPDEEAPRLLCVEMYRQQPLAYVTERAGLRLAQLNETGRLVPTTTRTAAQFNRIHLPGPVPALTIVSNGGVLLRDGTPDLEFAAAVTQRLAAGGVPFEQWCAESASLLSPEKYPFVLRSYTVPDLFHYHIVDRNTVPDEWLASVNEFALERGWTVSLQGRKLYLVPAALTKSAAAVLVRDMVGASELLSAGDSLLDAPLLEVANRGIRPAHGELHECGVNLDHIAVTSTSGVAAGEEIVDWMLNQLS